VHLHSKDLSILKEIQEFFGEISNIYTFSNKETVKYSVQDLKLIKNVIMPHFKNYLLQSAKKLIMFYEKNVLT
jgi:hypothetical protein